MKKYLTILAILIIIGSLAVVVYADLTGTEGLAIDLSSAGAGTDFTIAFDPTELLGNRTWGDASTDTIVWTFNRATGSDPTITFNSGSIALPALTLATPLEHESGGIEADISAIADGGMLVGTGAGSMAIRASALTAGAAGFFKHELGGIEADISAIADGGMLVGTGAGTMAIRASFMTAGAAGTIKHELGGVEADVSGYSGFVGINGGSTLDGDTLAELLTAMGDVTAFITDDDMPAAGTDPDVDAAGELGRDTDGANEPNDVVLRTASISGSQQYALAQVIKSFQGTIIKPNDLDDATRDALPVWENSTGMIFTITKIRAWSDTDDTTVNVETYDSDWDNNATVDALEIATDGTANYYVEETTITAATIADGSLIVLDFDDTDDPGWVKFNIMGWFNSDVN